MRIYNTYITFTIDNVEIKLQKGFLDKTEWTLLRTAITSIENHTLNLILDDKLVLAIHVLDNQVVVSNDIMIVKITNRAKLMEIIDDIINIPWN